MKKMTPVNRIDPAGKKLDSTFADEVMRQGMNYLESLLRTFDPLEQGVFNLFLNSKTALSTKAIRRNLVVGFIRYLGMGGKPPHLTPLYDFLPTNPDWHEKFRNLIRREAVKKGFIDIFEERPLGVLSQDEMRFYEKIARAHGFVLPGFRRVKLCIKNLETLGFLISRKRYEKGEIYAVHPRIVAALKKEQNNKIFNNASKGDLHGQKEEKKV
jgi:hypothetical protein